jgi:hypothetical protein
LRVQMSGAQLLPLICVNALLDQGKSTATGGGDAARGHDCPGQERYTLQAPCSYAFRSMTLCARSHQLHSTFAIALKSREKFSKKETSFSICLSRTTAAMSQHCMYSADHYRSRRKGNLRPSRVIPRVLCPRCGLTMRLSQARIQSAGDETLIFDCVCPFEYRMSPRARDEAAAVARASL